MKWIWVLLVVCSSTVGDVASAKGMTEGGEQANTNIRKALRIISTHRTVILGIVCNAISFIAFLKLLSVANLSFAVPATALGYILKTFVARFYLREHVNAIRWIGVVLVACGIVLIAT